MTRTKTNKINGKETSVANDKDLDKSDVQRGETEERNNTNQTEKAMESSKSDDRADKVIDDKAAEPTSHDRADDVQPVHDVESMASKPSGDYANNAAPAAMPSSNSDQSLNGIEGWLAFFVVVFGVAALVNLWDFFAGLAGMASGDMSASSIVATILSLVLAGVLATAAVFTALQKKVGRLLSIVALGVSYVCSAAVTIISSVEYCQTAPANIWFDNYCDAAYIIKLVGMLVLSLIVDGLLILYFIVSRRVKETLIK